MSHTGMEPSPWVRRWTHLIPAHSTVLDVACGGGRHLRWLQQQGHAVWGVDRDIAAAVQAAPQAQLVQADIEGAAWPLMEGGAPRRFGAVVVTNYLHRPLWPILLDSLAPGGVLLYETFAEGNASVGRPARPEFLLHSGELLKVCATLHVVAYEQGFATEPDRFIQRIAAVRPQAQPLGPEQVRGHVLSG